MLYITIKRSSYVRYHPPTRPFARIHTDAIKHTNTPKVDKDGVLTALIILFCTVSVFVTSLVCTRWHMNKTLGYCLLTAYLVYALYTILAEALA